jgi:DNA-binding LacI/PurR family transcriptional regulator
MVSRPANLKRAGIYDVARLARVSPSAVSLAINAKGRLSERTRERVLAACEKLRYRPHPTARFLPRLRTKNHDPIRTDLFAFMPVVPPNQTADFYFEYLKGVASSAAAARRMVIYQPIEVGERIPRLEFNRLPLDGRILVGAIDDAVLELFDDEGLSRVIIGDHACRRPVWNVDHDWYEAAQRIVNRLLALGHRRIKLIGQRGNPLYQNAIRHGFRDAHQRNGVMVWEDVLNAERTDVDDPLEMWLQRKDRPTALIAVEGGAFAYAMNKVNQLGFRVPGDLSLVLIGSPQGDASHVAHMDPSYETVGRQAMELVGRLSRGNGEESGRILVPLEFSEGNTCGLASTEQG